ncbi:Raftlin-2 [Liparis tanakae]|uniref:Raftlin-2 n=1 Tax=Liparis tanakae TaxID=230148 RepID=A0A4Z2EXH4_9TELE|nr:Raftlin-2 [Liparis tanakae]
MLPKSVESVFIFQEASEGEPNAATPAYDAIVVEQWTVINLLRITDRNRNERPEGTRGFRCFSCEA